jgi:hypothetical protein
MTSNQDLMQRLAVSKRIMEKTENLQRNTQKKMQPSVQEFEPVNATYNLPQEFLPNQDSRTQYDPSQPLDENKILNSKLPDEIKRLMIEQPIIQPNSIGGSAHISEEVIQGAQRLMSLEPNKNSENSNKNIKENVNVEQSKINYSTTNFNVNDMKSMIRDVVRDTVRDVVREELKEAGMLVESTQNTDEVIQFKVGNHLFVGRVTKIKKLENK